MSKLKNGKHRLTLADYIIYTILIIAGRQSINQFITRKYFDIRKTRYPYRR